MVFIYKVKDIIKIFEECSRKDIGISLLAYEEFISKGLKVSDKDIERLTKVFDYYDDKLSNDYPSLTNESLQECDNLICDYFNETDTIIKDGYKININFSGRYKDTSCFDIEVADSTGYLVSNFKSTVNDKNIKSDYGKDSFNTIYNACEEVRKEIIKTDIKNMIDSFKL